ncbi:endopeptidase La, partial [Bacteroides xylanisolvens]
MKERYLLEDGSDNGFSLITDYDGNDEQAFDVNVKSGEILPVLPLRNMVLFPGVFLPITVGRKSSLKLIRDADKKHKDIAVVCQRSAHTEDPKLEDLHNIGTVGRIVRILE